MKKDLITSSINLNRDWNNNEGSNCYAYALGIDRKENDIMTYAFQPGMISSLIICESNNRIDLTNYYSSIMRYSLKDRVKFDLEMLGILFNEVQENENSLCDIDSDGYLSWIIAMYEHKGILSKDFHFLRKLPSGIWTHKMGYYDSPTEYETTTLDEHIILNKKNYDQKQIVKLRLKL